MAELNLNWQTQEITPTLVSGEDALRLYNLIPEKARVGLRYDESTQTIIGSTPFAVAVLDVEAQKYGARSPNLRDLSRSEIMKIAQGKHYIDSKVLVARSQNDTNWPKNNSLLKTIYELAEEKLGRIEKPFMIEGFTFEENPQDVNGYGLNLVANQDFKVTQDERLNGEYNRMSFSEVDELGLPKFGDGKRTWYAKNNGLSGLFLDAYLYLNSYDDDLFMSNDKGRVVVVSAGGAENFSGSI